MENEPRRFGVTQSGVTQTARGGGPGAEAARLLARAGRSLVAQAGAARSRSSWTRSAACASRRSAAWARARAQELDLDRVRRALHASVRLGPARAARSPAPTAWWRRLFAASSLPDALYTHTLFDYDAASWRGWLRRSSSAAPSSLPNTSGARVCWPCSGRDRPALDVASARRLFGAVSVSARYSRRVARLIAAALARAPPATRTRGWCARACRSRSRWPTSRPPPTSPIRALSRRGWPSSSPTARAPRAGEALSRAGRRVRGLARRPRLRRLARRAHGPRPSARTPFARASRATARPSPAPRARPPSSRRTAGSRPSARRSLPSRPTSTSARLVMPNKPRAPYARVTSAARVGCDGKGQAVLLGELRVRLLALRIQRDDLYPELLEYRRDCRGSCRAAWCTRACRRRGRRPGARDPSRAASRAAGARVDGSVNSGARVRSRVC